MFEPLKITAWLQSPVISDTYLPLDSILDSLARRERNGFEIAACPGVGPTDDIPIPIERIHAGDDVWYYACSFAQWGRPYIDDTQYWHKRMRIEHAALLKRDAIRGRLQQGEGRYRSYRMPVFTRHALYISWYALGSHAGIAGLLPFVTHIGKKTAQGFGAVLRWEVNPALEDHSIIGPGGRIMRSIPSNEGTLLYGFRPAYWDRRNQAVCIMPET